MGDAAIRETDTDAAVSRLSAVNAGYLVDPFARLFVKRPQTRPPLINIGTFLRTWAIDKLVHQFLDAGPGKKQVVSLGSGTDTRFFRIASEGGPRAAALAKYVEVDFPEATTKKAMSIRKNTQLNALLGFDVQLEQGGTELQSQQYLLLPGDLRNFTETIAPRLQQTLDPSLPTLVLAECVFIYLDPRHSETILRWLISHHAKSGLVSILYDPVGLDDPFGRVMINNLRARGLELHGLQANKTLQIQRERILDHGFSTCVSRDVKSIRTEVLPQNERERIAKLEMLDEIEELDLLLSHYSIVVAQCPAPGETAFANIGLDQPS